MKKVGFLSIASILMLLSSCEKLRYDLVPTRIEGKVVDILTGEPIPFAEITLWKSGDTYRIWKVASYQADAEGNFKIKHKFKYYKDDHPPINNYYISAKKDGYYKKINHSKYELKIDANKEAYAGIEPTRANKNIVLKLIPITKATIELEDIPPYENANRIFFLMSGINKYASFSGMNAEFLNVNSNQYNLNTVYFDSVVVNDYSVKIEFYNTNWHLLKENEYGNIKIEYDKNNFFKIQY
jgi:hypothetical protein